MVVVNVLIISEEMKRKKKNDCRDEYTEQKNGKLEREQKDLKKKKKEHKKVLKFF